MAFSNAELLIIKAELLDNPNAYAEYGDIQNANDDERNANALNQVRDSVQIDRASVPSSAKVFVLCGPHCDTSEWPEVLRVQQTPE